VPPLGLLYIIAALRKHQPGMWEIKLIHTGLEENPIPTVEKTIASFQPDVVGLSALTCEVSVMRAVAHLAKTSGATVVVGGPHASGVPEEVLREGDADFVVINEGDETALELFDRLSRNVPAFGIDGTAWRDADGTIFRERPREFITDGIDDLPFPAWDVVDLEDYKRPQYNMAGSLKSGPYALLFTSRGCPYQCTFCHKIMSKKFRAFSAERALAEMKWLVEEKGVREFHIIDDIFNFDVERAKAICRGIIANGWNVAIAFPNGVRTDRMDRELVDLLEQAGCYKIYYAIESASTRVQKEIQKHVKLDKAMEMIQYTAKKPTIMTCGFFMVGFPNETADEIRQSIRYSIEADFDAVNFFKVVPYPGTQLETDAIAASAGDAGNDGNYDDFHFLSKKITSSRLEIGELNRLFSKAQWDFWKRPKILFRYLRKHPNKLWALRNICRTYQGIFESYVAAHRSSDEQLEKLTAEGAEPAGQVN